MGTGSHMTAGTASRPLTEREGVAVRTSEASSHASGSSILPGIACRMLTMPTFTCLWDVINVVHFIKTKSSSRRILITLHHAMGSGDVLTSYLRAVYLKKL